MLKSATVQEMREKLYGFGEELACQIVFELIRIGRPVRMCEFHVSPFTGGHAALVTHIYLKANKAVFVAGSHPEEFILWDSVAEVVNRGKVPHLEMLRLFEKLKEIKNGLKVYVLHGRGAERNITFTIEDLVPLDIDKNPVYNDISSYINYSAYTPDMEMPVGRERKVVLKDVLPRNNLFYIKDTGVCVTIDRYIFPTSLIASEVLSSLEDH